MDSTEAQPAAPAQTSAAGTESVVVQPTPAEHRDGLLGDARRGYAAVRKIFVQRPNTEAERPALLAKFVTERKEAALDAYLLVMALNPILGDPLYLRTWARILSTKRVRRPSEVRGDLAYLESLNLISVSGDPKLPTITPLLEDGSGSAWTPPGSDPSEGGLGYFTIPFDYWTSGLVDDVGLPAKAALLITLRETQDPRKPAFVMAYERAPEWYGVSERTAERGYADLGKRGLITVTFQQKRDNRHPLGWRTEHSRSLNSPYSTDARQTLQKAAKAAVVSRSTTTPKGRDVTARRLLLSPLPRRSRPSTSATTSSRAAADVSKCST